MSLTPSHLDPRRAPDRDDPLAAPARGARDRFDTAIFTGLNVAVFLLLAASVVVAAVLYGQGA